MSSVLQIPFEEKMLRAMKPKIDLLEKIWLNQEQVPCPVVHRFAPGVCVREVSFPANTYAIGHHQNFAHLNILLKGRVSIRNDDGTLKELKAPLVFIGAPGRKVGFIHEATTWLNVWHTHETDVEKIEAHFLTKSQGFMEMKEHIQNSLLLKSRIDQEDFRAALKELGVTEEECQQQSSATSDIMGLPYGEYKIKVGASRIAGRGLLATADIKKGEEVAPARILGKRTDAGRFTNHSRTPNAKMVRRGSDVYLIATTKLNGQHGGMDGDEITIDYREAYLLTKEIGAT